MGNNRIVHPEGIILLDEEDFDFVVSLGLSILKRGHLRHVIINTKPYYKQYLHRVLLQVTDSNIIVDHIDNNGLNNQRANLRLTNKVGNALNMRRNYNKRSGLPKGVYNEREGYKACIQVNGLNKYLGHFTTIEAAEGCYRQAAEEAWKLV